MFVPLVDYQVISHTLDVENIGGVFILLGIGLLIGVLCLVIEMATEKLKVGPKNQNSFE